MPRLLIAISAVLALAAPVIAQEAAPAAPLAMVFFAEDPQAIEQFVESAATSRRMVDQLVLACTGRREIGEAWRTLVTPADRVGIKVSTAGGAYLSSHRGVVEAIVSGLVEAGLRREQIVIWDRDATKLRAAGFVGGKGRPQVRSIAPIRGYDVGAKLTAPVLGKLIWGDVLFREKQPKRLGLPTAEPDQLSSTSHLATVLSQEVTKVINVPVLSDEPGCGLAGALYNMTVPNVDNWRRFTQADASGGEAIPDLYADERIGGKVVLHIVDGLVAQYAGGPGGNLNYAFPHATLYASKDPVALDSTVLRRIEGWRKQAKLPPIGQRADWLKTAEELGLGVFEEERITLQQVSAR